MVPCPCSPRRARARSATSRTSFTPALTADSVSNAWALTPAMSRAIVVLPVPGGPQSTSDDSRSDSISTRSDFPAPSRCCWPTTSFSERGRNRAASGARLASRSSTAAANKSGPRATTAGYVANPPITLVGWRRQRLGDLPITLVGCQHSLRALHDLVVRRRVGEHEGTPALRHHRRQSRTVVGDG